jgi:hypothetical protein
MPVTTRHPTYHKAAKQWKKNRDVCEGEQAVKDAKTTYLPGFQPEDVFRYRDYIKRARFLNATGRTKRALVGAVFGKQPEIEVPPQIEYLLEDADGSGESIIQLSKRAVDEVLITGRYLLLADYPVALEGLTAEQVRALELRAHIVAYSAENIINWKTITVAGRQRMSLVVLHEKHMEDVDQFESREIDRYRVLALDENMHYYQQLYNEYSEPLTDPQYARDASGSLFSEIPCSIIGAQDNKPCIDDAPLTDLANDNISWYRVSADHMENLHMHGQLTLGVTSNMDYEQFKQANPSGVVVGARAGHFLGESGAFHTATAPESSSLSRALEDIKADMIAMGARIIEPRLGQRTAKEARMQTASEMSVLETVVGNCSEGIEKAMEFVSRFMGADESRAIFQLNTEFFPDDIDPQSAMAIIQFGDAGIVARSDQRRMLRTGRIELDAERTDEEIDGEISNQSIL